MILKFTMKMDNNNKLPFKYLTTEIPEKATVYKD